MSATVTYKGNTLTTVNNNTKTLKTAGKYMEDDIVLVDTTAEESQENNPIRFFDYDGTIVASYTEVPESLPLNPTHEGLTAQGWNWTLEDIATQFESTGACDIGQMYVTDDGKTRIYITVSDQTKSFWLGFSLNGTVSIDWGDGSENSNMTKTSYIKVHHEYATAGSYVISIEVKSGEFAFYNQTSSYTMLLGKYELTDDYYNYPYGGCVTAIELGNNVNIRNYAFSKLFNMKSITIPNSVTGIYRLAFENCCALEFVTLPNNVTYIDSNIFDNCYSLKSVAIPNSVPCISGYMFHNCYALESIIIPNSASTINPYAFQNCYSLKSVTIPNNLQNIKNNVFQSCYALKSITIPDRVTGIDTSAFDSCYALESITISDNVSYISNNAFNFCCTLKSITLPRSVTQIGSYAFSSCYNMDEYHFLSTTPPTLIGTNVFYKIQSNCKIYVPYSEDHSVLNAYKTATN